MSLSVRWVGIQQVQIWQLLVFPSRALTPKWWEGPSNRRPSSNSISWSCWRPASIFTRIANWMLYFFFQLLNDKSYSSSCSVENTNFYLGKNWNIFSYCCWWTHFSTVDLLPESKTKVRYLQFFLLPSGQ